MKCYNSSCNNECDDFKKAVCLNRITEKMVQGLKEIYGDKHCRCNSMMTEGRLKVSKIEILLCTRCGSIRERKMVKSG